MFGKFFDKKEPDGNVKIDDIIKKAIGALTTLTKFYQKDESEQANKIQIELKTPWQSLQLVGGSDKGISGVLVLTRLEGRGSLEDHPLIIALHGMNIRLGSNTSDGKSLTGTFSLYHLPSIEAIPTKCEQHLEEIKEMQERGYNIYEL